MKSSLDRMEHGVLAFHALANLDQGDFTEGHELDRKWRVPKEMGGDGYRRRKRRGCWLRGGFEISCQACSSSSKAFASFKSRVSKPSVNQPEIGARRLCASSSLS